MRWVFGWAKRGQLGFGVSVEPMNRLTRESIVWSSEFRVVVELGNCLTGKLRGWWLFGVRGSMFGVIIVRSD